MYRLGLFSLLAVLVSLSPLPASWGNGFCGPVGSPTYRWQQLNDDDYALWCGNVQIGNYRPSDATYHPRLAAGLWGDPCNLPAGLELPVTVKAPAKPQKAGCPCCGDDCRCGVRPCDKPDCKCVLSAGHIDADGKLNFGLDKDRMPASAEHVLNGKEVSKDELMQAIGKSSLPDDAKQLCVTVIGPEAKRKQVRSDLDSSPALAAWKGKIKVQDYPPDHWAVKDAGFVTTGDPTIYCQAPDGKVLSRQDDYRGPEALAEVLRKADPTYQSQKDPDLSKPFTLQSIPLGVWIVGAVIGFLILKVTSNERDH